MSRRKITTIIATFGIAAVFLAGVFFDRTVEYNFLQKNVGEENARGTKPQGVNFSVFWEAWRLIEANFVGAKNLNHEIMVYGAVSGLAESLGDPNTEFLNPEATARFRERIVAGTDLNTIEWKLLEEDIAHIRLFRFTRASGSDFEEAAPQILESRAKSVILDLRDNPGGAIDVLASIAGWFFEKGEAIAVVSYGEGRGELVYKSQGNGRLGFYPTVILINKRTASVAEVLSYAMRESKGVKLVGKNSMGKGSVQQILSLSGDTALRLTTSILLSPKGHLIPHSGLKPDVEILMDEAEYGTERDAQLNKAVEMLKSGTM